MRKYRLALYARARASDRRLNSVSNRGAVYRGGRIITIIAGLRPSQALSHGAGSREVKPERAPKESWREGRKERKEGRKRRPSTILRTSTWKTCRVVPASRVFSRPPLPAVSFARSPFLHLIPIESAITRGRIITAITDREVTDCRNKHKPAPLSDRLAVVLCCARAAPDTVVGTGR